MHEPDEFRQAHRVIAGLMLATLIALALAQVARADQSDLKVVSLTAATSTAVAPANTARKFLRICNPGANPAACTTLATATATNGEPIPAAGCLVFEQPALAIMARRCLSTSGTTLTYSEVTRDAKLSAPTPTPTAAPTPTP